MLAKSACFNLAAIFSNVNLLKLTLENIAARLKQADLATKINVVDLVKKTDFDNKLLGFNKKKLAQI